MRTAKAIIHARLPIKCIEAVFLGMYLTAGWKSLQRWTLSFKSTANAQTYRHFTTISLSPKRYSSRHIVLVVHDTELSRFGALGISRQATLMFKELTYQQLSDLVHDFLSHYRSLGHDICRVALSLPVEHDLHHSGPVGWNCCVLDSSQLQSEATLNDALGRYMESMEQLLHRFGCTGAVPRFKTKSLLKE